MHRSCTERCQLLDLRHARYGTDFARFDHTEENVRRCFEAIERMDMEDTGRGEVGEATVARPSPDRAARKQAMREALEEPRVREALAAARALHAEFVS